MSEKAKRYKDMYIRGLITEEKLLKLVEKGIITKEEYEWIIAEENVE